MLGSGAFIGGAAMFLVGILPAGVAWRAAGLVTCVALVSVELGALRAAYRRVAEYRIAADGAITMRSLDGREARGELLAGSVVLEHYAWLRLVAPQGSRWGELVGRRCNAPDEWRRLRVICRHLSAC